MNLLRFENFKDNKLEIISRFIKNRCSSIDINLLLYLISYKYNYNNFLFISDIEYSNSIKDIKKCYIILDGKYFDGLEHFTKDEIINDNKLLKSNFKDLTFVSDISYLKSLCEINDKLNDNILNEFKNLIKNI